MTTSESPRAGDQPLGTGRVLTARIRGRGEERGTTRKAGSGPAGHSAIAIETTVAGLSQLDPATVEQRSALTTTIVSMPFMDIDRPSIQLGLLKSVAEANGFPVQTLHANLDFAVKIGCNRYRRLSEHRGRLLGDWLFSLEAFGDAAPDNDGRLLDDFADELDYLDGPWTDLRAQLLYVRHCDVPAYLDALIDGLAWNDIRVVAFSSTFQQNAASFALARRLKRRHPDIVTVFGGANFDGGMGLELVRTVECIDIAVIGDGDVTFPRVLAALAAGHDPDGIPGVARRVGGQVISECVAPPRARLDDLPIPDYAEYFTRAEELEVLQPVGQRRVWIPFESARGCWWGEKHHCTFCGLNGTTMAFRAKSHERVLIELAEQARRCRSFQFAAVDNILDLNYLATLLPALAESGADYQIFYEVKSNLNRAQLKLMAEAGVSRIQPGLESLSSNVLRLMRKGVRAAQNVNVLRWAQYYNIEVGWNILWGFPGETDEDYAEQAATVSHLRHLRPPLSAGRIWLERFSPLYAEARTRTPERSYRYVYPDTIDLDRVAYFFENELDSLPDSAYAGLAQAVAEWTRAWKASVRPALIYWSAPGFLQIYDGRHAGQEGTYTFQGTLADIYVACSNRPMSASAVGARLSREMPVEQIQEVFHEFQRRGLMFLDGSLGLALALPAVGGR
jgi:ribosomal peptide maturation radical SAM protein 1